MVAFELQQKYVKEQEKATKYCVNKNELYLWAAAHTQVHGIERKKTDLLNFTLIYFNFYGLKIEIYDTRRMLGKYHGI